MASVSSLDHDVRNLRRSRYTPQAGNEAREWIERSLNEPLPAGDLLDALKDGVALCKLANLVLPPPGIKFKTSPMPFIQMENISHFLRACEASPLNLPAHDRFLTVDLYESKDPAQVLQCLGAFSRQAHAAKPDVFKSTIGPRKTGGPMSPSSTGGATPTNGSTSWIQPSRSVAGRSPSPTKASAALPTSNTRPMSPSLTGGSTSSQRSAGGTVKSPTGPVSSWSRKTDEGSTAPAWNIAQYGYMGGASQGNQGISFGARRQITSQAPAVPSLAEKERQRKEKAAEEEKARQQREEEEQRRRADMEAEEQQARADEERRWDEETKRSREEERRRIEEQKRQWEEDERRWKEQEEARRRENAEFAAKKPPEKPRVPSSSVLRGQTLSQYQKEQSSQSGSAETPEQKRVRELEKQLEEARERERQYQAEREKRTSRPGSARGSRPTTAHADDPGDQSWVGDERDYQRQQGQNDQENTPAKVAQSEPAAQQRPLPKPESSSRPLPERQQPEESQRMQQSDSASSLPLRMQPSTSASSMDSAPQSSPLGTANRPLPTPDKEYNSYTPPSQNRTDRYLSTHNAPTQPSPRVSASREAGDTSHEQNNLRNARLASQQKTTAGGWASKSLLEREMERERERQREWEANQSAIKDAPRDNNEGAGEGQSWDVNQYGYMGGDSMNRSSGPGSGIDFGGRRQILGPRQMKR